MRIKDIINFQYDFRNNLIDESRLYHPKFFFLLNYNDIIDENTNFEKIDNYYRTVVSQKITEYNKQVALMINEYIIELFNDSLYLYDSIGICTKTGYKIDDVSQYNKDSFIPIPEISELYFSVLELYNRYEFIPFWNKQPYTVSDGSRTYRVDSDYDAVKFIESNKSKFNFKYQDYNKLIINSVKKIDTFPSFYVKKVNISNTQERSIPISVHRHELLYAVQKQKEEGTLPNSKFLSSYIDNGILKIKGKYT